MKFKKMVLAAVALGLVCSPAAAQFQPDGEKFLDAVERRDGSTATQILKAHPTVIDSKNAKGDTALIVAIRESDTHWTGFLLNQGASPNAPGSGGDTPLIAAARVGFDDAAKWLLDLGAKVDGTNRSGETALIVAVQQRNARLVKALLAAGADPDRTDAAAGYSARDYANRDSRARDIQKLINDKKPAAGSAAK